MNIDTALLHELLESGDALAKSELSRRIGRAVDLDALRDGGCELDEHPQHGVRLIRSGLGTWVDYLHAYGGRADRLIELYRSTSSTQDAVRRIVEQHGRGADGALSIADHQTAGRGRLGRHWVAPPDSAVTFSRAVVDDGATVDRLTLATAVALCRAIDRVTDHRVPAAIKWPNDILVDGRKLAGILVESFMLGGASAAVIGVGMNAKLDPADLPADVRDTATSLSACGVEVDRLRLLAEAVRQIDACLAAADMDQLVDEWRGRSTLLGKDVRLKSNGQTIEGHVIDLDPAVGLTLRTHDGQLLHLHAATTTILPQPM